VRIYSHSLRGGVAERRALACFEEETPWAASRGGRVCWRIPAC